ncbi:hypothetical protein CCYA_CCYA02G0555 [Cyanidiococcus yangmingshanensis]|nr:hypothetical protein CCYA_CCYA02G0555 [Cyanidiococcus yangmingshanensis]
MSSRKRAAEIQIDKDTIQRFENESEVETSTETAETSAPVWLATTQHLKGRRIIRARRSGDRSFPDDNRADLSRTEPHLPTVTEECDQEPRVATAASRAAKLSPGSATRDARTETTHETSPQRAEKTTRAGVEIEHKKARHSKDKTNEPAETAAVHEQGGTRTGTSAAPVDESGLSETRQAAYERDDPITRTANVEPECSRSAFTILAGTSLGTPASDETPQTKQGERGSNVLNNESRECVTTSLATEPTASINSAAAPKVTDATEGNRSAATSSNTELPHADRTADSNKAAPKGFAGFTFGNISAPSTGNVSGFASFRFDAQAPSAVLGSELSLRGSKSLFDTGRGHGPSPGCGAVFGRDADAPEATDDEHDGDDHDSVVGASEATGSTALPIVSSAFNNESEEQVRHQTRAKLFELVEKQWRERGRGTVRLLYHPSRRSARMVMRVDGTLRVILNVPLTAETPRLDESGDSTLRFVAVQNTSEDAVSTPYDEPSAVPTPTSTVATRLEHPNRGAQVWCLRFAQRDQCDLFQEACVALQSSFKEASNSV